ncbi:MAG: hypothetical protein NC548_12815 [Lachnospiraceae bacterium]|nr:hypothetical protein [Lachnospiraceae bacterium]MCM1230728.1 hypothetical protein [Ruminococcus flavefaciens]
MNQRTCNIIMCCKNHCQLDGGINVAPLEAVATYMAHECACPKEDYKGHLMESIMSEALFDYMNCADRPGFELRQLFHQSVLREPTICERIATMFQLTGVRGKNGEYVNGFTKELLEQSEKDLSQ